LQLRFLFHSSATLIISWESQRVKKSIYLVSNKRYVSFGGGVIADDANHRVQLEVQGRHSSGDDGFNQNQTVNGKNYSCRFTGGTDGEGGVEVIRRSGKKLISVDLLNSKNYWITSVTFNGIGTEEFKLAPNSTGNKVFIDFRNVNEAAIKYSVFVVDGATGNRVDCDPPVKNVPQ
jgi:hypothetical protein